MLELHNVSKVYKGMTAVDDISFNVAPGQTVGYLGPNGAGKSTTVKMIIGLVQPSSGRITFDGQDISRDLQAFRAQLGYVPEEAQIYTHLTAAEYLALVGRLRGLSEAAITEKTMELLALFGLPDSVDVPMRTFSKGMKQRVLLSAALIHNPRLLVFDEPLSGLDAVSARLFKDLLICLASQGKMIVYISHVLEVVETVCDRVLILAKGKLLADASPSELRGMTMQPTLERVFTELTQHIDTRRAAEQIIQVIEG